MSAVSEVIAAIKSELTSAPVGRVRLRSEIEHRLREAGQSPARSAELSESSVHIALEEIERTFSGWDQEGIPRPFSSGSNNSILTGVLDRRYQGELPRDFFEMLNFVESASDHALLGISVLACAVLGCDRIFVTDKGGGDSGVDVLGRLRAKIGVGHTIYAIQAKAYASPLDRLKVEDVAYRFKLGLEESNWVEYRRASSVDELAQSPATVFVLLASKGLSASGSKAAKSRGIMASSPRQVALLLARCWTAVQVEKFCAQVPGTRNLDRNLFFEIPERKWGQP